MNNEMAKMTREKIELDMSSLICERSYTDRGLINEYLVKVETVLDRIDNVFNDETEILNVLLGGEFNPTKIFLGSFREKGIPLYFELDVLKAELEERYLGKEDLNGRVFEIIEKIGKLRDKATTLPFEEIFKPNEPLNKYAIEDIVRASGNMELTIERVGDIEYLAVKTTNIAEDVEYRNGDYISRGASYNTSKAMPLYQKDYDRLIVIEREKTKRNYDRMNQIVCKYFKNNDIPHTGDFHYQLINPELDSRIRIQLFALCSIYDKTFNNKYELANKCQAILSEIEEAEIQVRKEKETQEQLERLDRAIEKARERYNAKNFLWKFVHKKANPEKQNFEEMSVSEIDSLYVGRKK